jgi:hypothetical protein
MAKVKQSTGQITFRTSPEVHRDILEVANLTGTDVNAVLNGLVRDGLPAALQEARRAHERLAAARTYGEDLSIPCKDPVVRDLIVAARRVPRENRLPAMTAVARQRRRAHTRPLEDVVNFAMLLMDRVEGLYQTQRMILQQKQLGLLSNEVEILAGTEQRLQQQISEMVQEWEG